MKKIKVLFALACIALMATISPLASHAAGVGQLTGDDDLKPNELNEVNIYDLIENGSVSVQEVMLEGSVLNYAGFTSAMVSNSQWLILSDVLVTPLETTFTDGVASTVEGETEELGYDVQVYGLGPISYWGTQLVDTNDDGIIEEVDVPRPDIEAEIKLHALKVTYGHTPKPDGEDGKDVLDVEDVKYVVLSVTTNAFIMVDGELISEFYEFEVRSVAEDTYGVRLWLVANQGQQDGNEGAGGGQYHQ